MSVPRRSVLHFVHVFPPESHGGTELYVRDLARAQCAAGWRAVVVCGSERETETRDPVVESGDGLTVIRLPANWRVRDADQSCAPTLAAIAKILDESSWDVAHVHHWHNLSTDLVRTLAARGVPVVATLSDFHVTCPRFFRLPDLRTPCAPSVETDVCVQCLVEAFGAPEAMVRPAFIRRRAAMRAELAAARAVIVLSNAQARYMREIPLFHDVALDVVPYPAPSLGVEPRNPSPRNDTKFRIVSWGGLDPGKGFALLVDACQRVRDAERVELHHFGTIHDPGYRDALIASATRSAPVFHGRFNRDDLVRTFWNHDVAAFPSYYMETHGLVVDEAIQLGLPVLVSDRGAPPERVLGRGVVVPAGDVRAWADVIQGMMDDPTILARLRAAPAPRQYALETHSADIERMYERVLAHG